MDSFKASGKWLPQWRTFAINCLEFEAITRARLVFQAQIKNGHVLVMRDNNTTVTYINKQGDTRSKTSVLTYQANLALVLLEWHHAVVSHIWPTERQSQPNQNESQNTGDRDQVVYSFPRNRIIVGPADR